jgi:hypothetical protein
MSQTFKDFLIGWFNITIAWESIFSSFGYSLSVKEGLDLNQAFRQS